MTRTPTPEEVREVLRQADLIHPQPAVEDALDRIAAAITKQLGGANPLLLGVMVGGVVPFGCLLPRLDFPLQVDYLQATRYRGDVRGGILDWRVHPLTSLEGRVVLVVDDILDEGTTLSAILEHCRGAGAREVYSAVLVEKLHDRKLGIRHADITGLEVPDRYVFGCGMDYRGYLRNARGIYAVKGL